MQKFQFLRYMAKRINKCMDDDNANCTNNTLVSLLFNLINFVNFQNYFPCIYINIWVSFFISIFYCSLSPSLSLQAKFFINLFLLSYLFICQISCFFVNFIYQRKSEIIFNINLCLVKDIRLSIYIGRKRSIAFCKVVTKYILQLARHR